MEGWAAPFSIRESILRVISPPHSALLLCLAMTISLALGAAPAAKAAAPDHSEQVKHYYPDILNRHSADPGIIGSFTGLPRHLDHYLSETH